jgi:hypothetical protein
MPALRSVGVANGAVAVGFAPMLEQAELVLVPRGPFSLRAAAEFGFGPNEGRLAAFDGAMRLAFPLDGGRGHVGAVLRQERTNAAVTVELHCIEVVDQQAALRQLARIVSLDHDGEQFVHVGERDRGIGPFYAGLVVLRAGGFADALLPLAEPRGLAHLMRFYGLASEPSPERRSEIAEGWRSFRTWATVLIRLAGDRGTALADR